MMVTIIARKVRETEKAVLLNCEFIYSSKGGVKNKDLWFPKKCVEYVDETHYGVSSYILQKHIEELTIYGNTPTFAVEGFLSAKEYRDNNANKIIDFLSELSTKISNPNLAPKHKEKVSKILNDELMTYVFSSLFDIAKAYGSLKDDNINVPNHIKDVCETIYAQYSRQYGSSIKDYDFCLYYSYNLFNKSNDKLQSFLTLYKDTIRNLNGLKLPYHQFNKYYVAVIDKLVGNLYLSRINYDITPYTHLNSILDEYDTSFIFKCDRFYDEYHHHTDMKNSIKKIDDLVFECYRNEFKSIIDANDNIQSALRLVFLLLSE